MPGKQSGSAGLALGGVAVEARGAGWIAASPAVRQPRRPPGSGAEARPWLAEPQQTPPAAAAVPPLLPAHQNAEPQSELVI